MADPESPRLDQTLKDIRDIQRTDFFNTEQDRVIAEEESFNPYKSVHKSAVEGSVFFGPIFIPEALGIEIIGSNTKTPIYHYASSYFGFMLEGKQIIRGNLYIYETKTAQLHATIAKYKELLKQDQEETRVRDIVLQRLNLFEATIESQIINKFGLEKGARVSKQALKSITSEVINGLEWKVPKLVFVTGTITDKSPLIDVYEDIHLNKDSKAVLSDGATQIRVYGFIAKKRVMQEEPFEFTALNKWKVDLPGTIREYVTEIVNQIKKTARVSIKQESRPWRLRPNNIMFTGTLPNTVSSWGPKLCMSSASITQKGAPERMDISFRVHLYKESQDDQGSRIEIKHPNPPVGRAIITNFWRFFYPDVDILVSGVRAIASTIPTSPGLSYRWTLSPGSLPQDSAFLYQEEYSKLVTGSVLNQAFMGIEYVTPNVPDNVTTHKQPVRDYSYVHTPYVKSGVEEMTDYLPIHAAYGRKSVRDNMIVNWKEKEVGLQITDGFNYDKWYYLVPDGITIANLLGGGILTEGLEIITSGILGNVDGVNNYEIDIDPIPLSIGAGVDTLGVQVYPIGLHRDYAEAIFGPIKDLLVGIFTDEIDREDAIEILADPDNKCDFDACKYIWTIKDIQKETNRYLEIQKEILSKEIKLFDLKTYQKRPSSPRKGTSSYDALIRQIRLLEQDVKLKKESLILLKETGIIYSRLFISAAWNRDSIDIMEDNDRTPILLVRVISETPDILDSATDANMLKLRDNTIFISPASSTPSSEVKVHLDIRTDRSYITYDDRHLWNFFRNTVVNIFNEVDYNTESANQSMLSFWSSTIQSHKIAAEIGKSMIYAPAIGVTTIAGIGATAVSSTLSAAAEGIATGIDIAEGTTDVITSLPGISQTLDGLSSLGIDLKGIFKDSKIIDDNEYSLRNIGIYVESFGYIIHLSKLSEDIAFQLKAVLTDPDILRQLDDEPFIKDIGAGNIDEGSTKINNIVHTILDSELRRQFEGEKAFQTSPESKYGWKIVPINNRNLDRLNLGPEAVTTNPAKQRSNAFSAGNDKQDNEILILIKYGVPPSPLVLDKITREGLEDFAAAPEESASEEEARKGIVL